MPRDAPRRPETLEMNLDRRYFVNLAVAKRQPMGISPPLTYRHINLAPDNVPLLLLTCATCNVMTKVPERPRHGPRARRYISLTVLATVARRRAALRCM